MKNNTIKFPLIMVLCLMLVVCVCSPEAFAERGGRDRGNDHFYRNGGWYKHGWFGFDVAVAVLTIGALVESLPPRHTTVVVGGVPYYYYDSVYYRPYSGGYVVVPAPVVTQPIVAVPVQTVVVGQAVVPAQEPAAASDTQTINIPNSKGGYTAVALKKSGNGYIGPQGEYYLDNPTVEQLKTLYGK